MRQTKQHHCSIASCKDAVYGARSPCRNLCHSSKRNFAIREMELMRSIYLQPAQSTSACRTPINVGLSLQSSLFFSIVRVGVQPTKERCTRVSELCHVPLCSRSFVSRVLLLSISRKSTLQPWLVQSFRAIVATRSVLVEGRNGHKHRDASVCAAQAIDF
jgi:hypothetical protein